MIQYSSMTLSLLNKAFDNSIEDLLSSSVFPYSSFYGEYSIKNEKENKVVKINVAGHNKTNIKMEVRRNLLYVLSLKNDKTIRIFHVDDCYDRDNIKGKIEDGILTITFTLKKEEQSSPILIE